MSLITPDFLNFIKKLEDCDDKLTSVSPIEQPTEFEFNNSVCSACNGYYGPSFGEPVCVTCHAFLFTEFQSYVPCSYSCTEKTDDGDSGNDEPSDLNFSSEKRHNRASHFPKWWHLGRSLDSETSPEDDISRTSNSGPSASGSSGSGSSAFKDLVPGNAPPPQPPNLACTLQALSTPRLPDKIPSGIVEHLPPEVLLCIFRYLDDMSLCACACVCARWQRLVRARVPPERWAAFAALRWPLFTPIFTDFDWQRKYQSLVESSFCRTCLVQMFSQAAPAGEENSWRRNRLRSELKMLRSDPPEGLRARPLDALGWHWQAAVAGPGGSPYAGGLFYLHVQVPHAYPLHPPVVRFVTRVLHPNVSRHGDVGVDCVLHHNWTLALTVTKVLLSVQSLLTDPYTEVCMEPELGEMYVKDRARFEALARQWTWKYAMLDVLPF